MAKQHIVGKLSDLPPGGKTLVKLGSRSIGVFNVGGELYALLNVCPHQGAKLCEGPVCGTNLSTDGYRYNFAHDGEVLRCSRHGWEFKISTGECFGVPNVRAKTYPVHVENGDIVVTA